MKREDLRDLSGATTVPYIIDPNTGVQMSDSEKIIEYLYSTYSTAKFAPSA
jgi:anaphase-promoting complex subunit 7